MNLPRPPAFAALPAFLFAVAVHAQSAAPGSPSGESDRPDTVRMDPFEVKSERDFGYRATNSITATGSGTEIRNTPMNIAVLTSDFIEDKAATDIRDIVQYVSGVSSNPGKDEHEISSRGFQSVIKVDGGEENRGVFALDNAERVEVTKGPASVLQGRATAGGIVNIISRRPAWRPRHDLTYTFGSWDYRKLSVGATGPIVKDRVAYNLRYAETDAGGWADYTYRNEEFLAGALTLRPFREVPLELTLGFEKAERDLGNQQHLTMSHPAFHAMDLEAIDLYDSKGLARPASYPRIGETIRSWLNRTPGFGANEPAERIDVTEAMYPRGYRANVQGPQQFRRNWSERETAELRWQLADWLDLKATYYHSRTHRNNVDVSAFRAAGGLLLRERAVETYERQERADARTEFAARFSLLDMRHRILAGHQYRYFKSRSQNLQAPVINHNPRTAPVRMIFDEVRAANPNGFSFLPMTSGYEHSAYIVDQVEAWDERIHLMGGARFTHRFQGTIHEHKLTPQVGAVVRVPRIEGLSLYAGYSEGYRPNFSRDGEGNLIPPEIEANIEGGLKLDLWDGRFSGTMSVFKLDQENVALRDFAREAELGITPLYILSGEARSRGFEFDGIITPSRNYQILVSYSRLWEARTLAADDARQVGVRFINSPEAQAAIWNKYTFVDGPLKGAYVGAGIRWTDRMHIHPSWSVTIYSEPYFYGDLIAGYRWKIGSKVLAEVGGRVENLLDERYYDGTFRISQPRRGYVNAKFSF